MNAHLSNARYAELMESPGLTLADDETAAGWHFCPDWGGLLVGPSMLEWDSCNCNHDSLGGLA